MVKVLRAVGFTLVLLLVPLAGCLGSSETQEDPVSTSSLGPGGTTTLADQTVSVRAPVALPDVLASEPSITIADDGTIAVAAPAAGDTNPTLLTHGGYTWVSRDDGQTYTLSLDPGDPEIPASGCSCDTDVLAVGDELFMTTMYWTVNPVFNMNLVASQDQGRSWETRSPLVATPGPVDRPWLAADASGKIYALWNEATSAHHAVGLDTVRQPHLQASTDGGTTWSHPVPVAGDDPDAAFYRGLRPATVGDQGIVVPLQRVVDNGLQNLVAVSDDGGATFERVVLSEPYPVFAQFDYSIDAGPNGTVVAAWSAPAEETAPAKLHVRTSQDGGTTWGPVRVLDLPGHALQPWVGVRDDGRVAIAYYGSDAQATMYRLSDNATWQPRAVLLAHPSDASPDAVVTLSDGPTYQGLLCNSGAACPREAPSETPMREFLSLDWAPDGDLHVAWTDARTTDEEGHAQVSVTQVEVTEPGTTPVPEEPSPASELAGVIGLGS